MKTKTTTTAKTAKTVTKAAAAKVAKVAKTPAAKKVTVVCSKCGRDNHRAEPHNDCRNEGACKARVASAKAERKATVKPAPAAATDKRKRRA